jgi:protein-S-isoprenylcysteine O-methyltransferase Ste14
MYGGLLLASLGLASFGFSPARLIVTFVLFWFLNAKADKEEEYLRDAFEGYGLYKDRVGNKFWPSPSWLLKTLNPKP